MKKNEFMRSKQRDAQNELDRRIRDEQNIMRQKEQEVMQMEMLEMELIKKLQHTQAIQKQAYSDLEQALSNKANPLSNTTGGGGIMAYGKVAAYNNDASLRSDDGDK